MTRGRLMLKHIEAFRAVISTGSASKAAVQLGISQPAISKIVAQAEDLTGMALFERRLGRLIPTPESLLLYSETNALFATLERIDDIVSRDQARGATALPRCGSGAIHHLVAESAAEVAEKN